MGLKNLSRGVKFGYAHKSSVRRKETPCAYLTCEKHHWVRKKFTAYGRKQVGEGRRNFGDKWWFWLCHVKQSIRLITCELNSGGIYCSHTPISYKCLILLVAVWLCN